jgi:hypothetical protein
MDEKPVTDVRMALTLAKRLCQNINEFGHVTDAEILDDAEAAINKALATSAS